MVLEELPILMQLVSWLQPLLFNGKVVPIVKGERRLVPALDVLEHRRVVGYVSHLTTYSVSVEVKLENLPFLETEKHTAGVAREGQDREEGRERDFSTKVTNPAPDVLGKALLSPRKQQQDITVRLYEPTGIELADISHIVHHGHIGVDHSIVVHSLDLVLGDHIQKLIIEELHILSLVLLDIVQLHIDLIHVLLLSVKQGDVVDQIRRQLLSLIYIVLLIVILLQILLILRLTYTVLPLIRKSQLHLVPPQLLELLQRIRKDKLETILSLPMSQLVQLIHLLRRLSDHLLLDLLE